MITIAIDPIAPDLLRLVKPYGLHIREYRLYRFHDRGGQLLYLGITSCFPERWSAHRRTAPWWSQVDRVTVSKPFAHRAAAEEAERAAIRAEAPRYNKRSVPGWKPAFSEPSVSVS